MIVFYLFGAILFITCGLVLGVLIGYLVWGRGDDDRRGPPEPPGDPPPEGGYASRLDAVEHYGLIDDFVMHDGVTPDAGRVMRIL